MFSGAVEAAFTLLSCPMFVLRDVGYEFVELNLMNALTLFEVLFTLVI